MSARAVMAWHDDARSRDAGHDELQAVVWRHYQDLVKEPEPVLFERYGKRDREPRDFYIVDAHFEFPIYRHRPGPPRGEKYPAAILAFADVAAVLRSIELESERTIREERNCSTSLKAEYEPQYWYEFFEIKPVIQSVGAVIRQCKALAFAAERGGYRCHVTPVVYEDDPKFSLLEEVFSGSILGLPRESPP